MDNNQTNKLMFQSEIVDLIQELVKDEIKKQKLHSTEHFGRVERVLGTNKLRVYIDGQRQSQVIRANPDVNWKIGDECHIMFKNGNPLDKVAYMRKKDNRSFLLDENIYTVNMQVVTDRNGNELKI
ncbi:hypothetical protein [Halalkalibacter oceani]|uniref:hypothetical protein n=1 Tax=Halalkalibacter oceani TaxID=1653776 RepID=UPI00339A9D4B